MHCARVGYSPHTGKAHLEIAIYSVLVSGSQLLVLIHSLTFLLTAVENGHYSIRSCLLQAKLFFVPQLIIGNTKMTIESETTPAISISSPKQSTELRLDFLEYSYFTLRVL